MNNFLNEIKLKAINIKYLGKRNKVILFRDNDYNYMDIKFSSSFIKASNSTDIKLLTEKIKNFLIVMNHDCKNFDSTIFLKNIKKTLFDIENLVDNTVPGINGQVSMGFINKLNLNTFKAIYHELLHLASLNKNNLENASHPLDEGYTQLLAERYFDENIGITYKFEVAILRCIEVILGKDYLEQQYFSGNFNTVINDLSKYIGFKNTFNLYVNLNYIYGAEFSKEFESKKILYKERLIVLLKFCLIA